MRNLKVVPLFNPTVTASGGSKPDRGKAPPKDGLWLIGWIEVEPKATFEDFVSDDRALCYSQIMHRGAAVPVKRQEANKLFPLYTREPAEAAEADA